jgi:glutamate:GABA antiporter
MALGVVGSAAGFLSACARIPFAVGIDKRLPPVFARLHPRWGTPYVALIVQAVLGAGLMYLSQAGSSVRSAYDILISMMIIANFIPYLLLFAAMIKVQGFDAPKGTTRVPGGAPAAWVLASVGFLATAATIVLAFVPPPGEPDKVLAVVKIIGGAAAMLALGWAIYFVPGGRGRGAPPGALRALGGMDRPRDARGRS